MEDIKKYLTDIKDSIHSIEIHLGHKRDYNLFVENITIRRAVERELEIIGEATNRIVKMSPDFPISFAKQIVAMRNRVIHGYDSVDTALLWKIIVKDIPTLLEEIDSLLNQS